MKIIIKNNIATGIVDKDVRINSVLDMLDIMVAASYEHHCTGLIVFKESLGEAFFDLKTGFAGEILQKFSNYRMKIAIIGDFSQYSSKSFQSFIYECNRGNEVFFKSSVEDGVTALIGNS